MNSSGNHFPLPMLSNSTQDQLSEKKKIILPMIKGVLSNTNGH